MRIGGMKNYGRGETVVLVFLGIFWFCCWVSFGEPSQGAPGCWGFWARGLGFLTVSWS